MGETTARLAQALCCFTHACARRTMLWDVQHALAARAMLPDIRDPRSATWSAVSRSFEQTVAPVWPRLRAQVVHTDLTVDNTLTDASGLITVVVGLGDMSYTALIMDLASVLNSLGTGREGADLFRLARLVLDGYQRRTELEEMELAVLGVMWAARRALTTAITSWRVAHGLEEQVFAERFKAGCARTLETMEEVGWSEVTRQLRTAAPRSVSLTHRAPRGRLWPDDGAAVYDASLEVADADGVWITDTGGRRHLDAYNNVPCLGHGHPRVSAAISRQSRRINTHMRYLHPAAVELAERLVGLCPAGLDTVLLFNSGSEANDLTWRWRPRPAAGAAALAPPSPTMGLRRRPPLYLRNHGLMRPGRRALNAGRRRISTRGNLDVDSFAAALDRLSDREVPAAAAILDGLITSDRITDLEPAYVQELVRLMQQAGGLWTADKVQAGHGRSGGTMWAFERFDIVPDFVTIGKPMGNGHPVAAVVTRSEIVASLAGHTTLFSAFGGNPVSAAAALAVLDVIEDERVLDRVRGTGDALRGALAEVSDRHVAIGDVRGSALAWGIECVLQPLPFREDSDRGRRC